MSVIRIIAFTGVIAAAWFIGKTQGEFRVRTHTAVRYGEPYYQGNYFGKCAGPKTGLEYCATDDE